MSLATPSSRLFFGLLPWYSVLIVTGICLALWLSIRQEKRLGLPKDTVVDLALWVIPLGILGARIYYVVFAWETFAPNPISILYIWRGGMAIYGGIIGGFIAIVLFARKRHLPLSRLTDMIAPGLALAQAIGRWGNYFNMEAYGSEITNAAWQFFPAAVFIPSGSGGTWHMATFFYESLWDALVFAVLMLSRPRMRRSGDTTLWYFLLYGSGRLVIEDLRTDSLMASTLRVSQLLSALLCLAVVVVFILRARKSLKLLHFLPALLFAAAIPAVSLIDLSPMGAATLRWTAYALAMLSAAWAAYPGTSQ